DCVAMRKGLLWMSLAMCNKLRLYLRSSICREQNLWVVKDRQELRRNGLLHHRRQRTLECRQVGGSHYRSHSCKTNGTSNGAEEDHCRCCLANLMWQRILHNQGVECHTKAHTQAEHQHCYEHIGIG